MLHAPSRRLSPMRSVAILIVTLLAILLAILVTLTA